ncbi:class F sortase [Streptomyces sp. AcE210]|uniref:class F sortase n=1 Tax=Streptomyces sp. AcE210 TaxID=2292703 RepID=UPI000E303297|nr:class F sortase [Streptomyces sp. AcE210]RFC76861.1 class F sortase [Streptomyces sp. AcE210]
MAARLPSPDQTESVPPGRRSRIGAWIVWSVGIVVLAVSLFGGNETSSDTSDSSGASRPPAVAYAPSSDAVPPAPSEPPMMPAPSEPAAPPAAPETSVAPVGKHLPRARPTRLLIPKIGVDAPFTELAIGPTGQLQPPPAADTNLVGWQADGVSPGETGTAIIAGHVDTKTSAAVFANLRALKPGDTFTVKRDDSRTATFVVDSAETFAKNAFPDERVYGDTPQAQVRLITCTGVYDRVKKDYTDNLVVFAHLV